MLLPAAWIDVVDAHVSLAERLFSFNLASLPWWLAYPLTWLIVAIFFAIYALLLYPLGLWIWNFGYAVGRQVPLKGDLADRLRRAELGLQITSVSSWLMRHSGIGVGAAGGASRQPSPLPRSRPVMNRVLGAAAGGALFVRSFAGFLLAIVATMLRPTWLNFIRWLAVVTFLQQVFIRESNWTQVWHAAPKVSVQPSQVSAGVLLLFMVVGAAWPGGHKWTGKFHESKESKCLEFLQAAISPLSKLRLFLYKLVDRAPIDLHRVLTAEVERLTQGRCTVQSNGEVSCDWADERRPWGGWRTRPESASMPDLGPVTALRELYAELRSGGWELHLGQRAPGRIYHLVSDFNHTLNIWAIPLNKLSVEDIRRRVEQDISLAVARKLFNEPPARDEGGVVGQPTDWQTRVESHLTDAVLAGHRDLEFFMQNAAADIAEIRMLERYARRQTSAGFLKRLLLNR